MSGPVSTTDAPPGAAAGHASSQGVEVSQDREAVVGRFRVRRALPRRGRRTVGAWCFVDHIGPADVTQTSGLDVGPHPHMGLQTVTWLIEGETLHRDSLGSEQVIKPGQLNLMTAGAGVSHSEEATGSYQGGLHGIQLWVAQPSGTRHGAPAFEHHTSLPRVELGAATATVLVGDLAGTRSPARHDTPLAGVDVAMQPGVATVPVHAGFEYALIVIDGAVTISDHRIATGQLGYLGRGRDKLVLHAISASRVLLLGGEPFDEPILMWWNFVARDRDELEVGYRDWQRDTGRFGLFSSPLPRIPAPGPYWTGGAA
jgi:redox-sensitive bicupin YhaK (pirin superfamily)